ncbi:LOW QUALITY PROTEIN: tyrosine-protein phosphatase non-receptor type 23 [Atheta coriaria]|uniref:LOW QUALITY PROTEIN: tyrosine-protein phosphatase non-receptor type 23 n=1 Tax=Dalotia coriaria TaxID=877792 RepID=UPI0031F441A6
MEALPRLPMVSFELLSTSEKVSFAQKLKLYIASFYQEDPESYNNEIRTLEGLRAQAVWPSIDINSCQIMKKYYCQLHFLKSRFPMEENQISSVFFAWKDDYTKMSCNMPDVNFELMCMLINIGCIHSKLGAEDTRTTPEGMKMSCTHFQCAAWAFQTVRETYGQLIGLIMISSEQIRAMQLMCLAQAQECILEKSLLDNRKPTIIAKIAVQLCEYYKHAGVSFQSGDDCLVLEHFPNHKYLAQYLQFKIDYHRCIALLYQGQQAEEQQKMGERVAFYQAAVDMLDEAVKHASKMCSSSQVLFKDTIAFTLDVVKGKHKAAVNENEFIYHEDVPHLASLQEIKGASLVKGIPFNVHDPEVAGSDIFGRLVPMEAHEASSLYSEKKAQLLRNVGERVEQKDMELCDFLNSMQLEVLGFVKSAKGLPQELVDRAASMVARPNATKELVEAMGKLSNSYQEVEAMLQEIQEMLKVEEESEKEYQQIMGKRPPSIIATDLARESAKYQEAHGKASESNMNLHKAMTTHAANIKLLAQPLNQLVQIVPTLNLPDPNVDETILESIEGLMSKVDEMKNQRMMLWNQFREAIHSDDITGAIVTKQADQSLDEVFQQALDKHSKVTAVIDQNLLAQENICKALVEMYAKFTPTRKYLQDLFHKRNTTLSALISSHDTYDDLILKANKGIEFYSKLESNVSKLLGRIKSACNVQQEERDQMLIKNGHSKQHSQPEPVPQAPAPEMNNATSVVAQSNTNNINMQHNALNNVNIQQPSKPKLKDYLDTRKDFKEQRVKNDVLGPQMQYPSSPMYGTTGNVAGAGQALEQPWQANYNQNLPNSPYAANSTPPPTQQTPQATPTPTPPPPAAGANSYGTYYPYAPPTASAVPDNASYPPPNQSYASNQQYNSTSYQYPSNVGVGVAPAATTPSLAGGVNYMYQTPATGTDYGYNAPGYNYNNQYTNGVYDYTATVGASPSVAAYQYPTPTATPVTTANVASSTETSQLPAIQPAPKKESSIDLLAGLDFSINQAPLIPQVPQQQKQKEPPKADVIETQTPPKKIESVGSNAIPAPVKKKNKILLKGDPLKNPMTVEQFLAEVEKFEKYVGDLSIKTLSGPSNLELRWKEIQESQENMEATKKSISVARCYPLKNRSPDILPYDHSRVALVNTKDDYINASHVSVGPYCMDFVLTQLPLAHTVQEFWNMVWEQQIETVVCLLADNEINEGCYWPAEPGKDLNVTRRVILAHSSANEHFTEHKLTISDEKESRLINIFQYTAWPGSLFPTNATPFIDFLQLVVKNYEKQKCIGNPVLVHCLAGVGRTGICAALLAGLMEFAAVACPLPDIPAIAAKISCARKNVLRDREHLKFVYTTLLQHLQTVRKGFIKCDNDKADEMVKKTVVVDPFSELDPLWATRKS